MRSNSASSPLCEYARQLHPMFGRFSPGAVHIHGHRAFTSQVDLGTVHLQARWIAALHLAKQKRSKDARLPPGSMLGRFRPSNVTRTKLHITGRGSVFGPSGASRARFRVSRRTALSAPQLARAPYFHRVALEAICSFTPPLPTCHRRDAS